MKRDTIPRRRLTGNRVRTTSLDKGEDKEAASTAAIDRMASAVAQNRPNSKGERILLVNSSKKLVERIILNASEIRK